MMLQHRPIAARSASNSTLQGRGRAKVRVSSSMTTGGGAAAAAAAAGGATAAATAQQQQQRARLHAHAEILPARHTKVIHLVRHAQGYHNVAGRENHDNYKSWDYFDSHLSEEGWRQARVLGAHVHAAGIRPDVVVVSPLVRALETAVGAFGSLGDEDGGGDDGFVTGSSGSNGNGNGSSSNGNGSSSTSGDLLMAELTPHPGRRAAQPAVRRRRGAPPFVAAELCREHLGVHPCDRRRPLNEARALFPGVDFSSIGEEEDALWRPDHRETKDEIMARGRAFVAELLARPEREIAVVSHSSFLHYMLLNYAAAVGASAAVAGDLHRWFENCELRTVVLADLAGAGGRPADPLHFAGFAAGVPEGPQAPVS